MRKFSICFSLLSVLAIVLIVFVFSIIGRSDAFQEWLKRELVTHYREMLQSEITIDKIKNRFFTDFSLTGISLLYQGDTLAYVPQLNVRFNPLALLKKNIDVESLNIFSPRFMIKQDSDRTWNIVKAFQSRKKPESDSTAVSQWSFHCDHIRLSAARIEWSMLSQSQEKTYEANRMDLSLSLSYRHQQLALSVRSSGFTSPSLPVHIKKISADLWLENDTLSFRHFDAQTDKSRFTGHGMTCDGVLDFTLNAEAIHWEELQSLFPSLPLHGSAGASFHFVMTHDSLRFSSEIAQAETNVSARGFINLPSHNYRVDGEVRDFDLQQFLPDLKAASVNGSFSLQGSGTTAYDSEHCLTLHITSRTFHGYSVDSLKLRAVYKDEQLHIASELQSGKNRIILNGMVEKPFDEQYFHARMKVEGLNLAEFSKLPDTDLHFTVDCKGQGLYISTTAANWHLNLSPSLVHQFTIDTAFAQGRLQKGSLLIDTLTVNSPLGAVHLHAGGSIPLQFSARYSLHLSDVAAVTTLFSDHSFSGNGTISGLMQYQKDSLEVHATCHFFQTRMFDLSADTLAAHFDIRSNFKNIVGNGHMTVLNNRRGGAPFTRLEADAGFSGQHITGKFSVSRGDSLMGQMQADITLDQAIAVTLRDMEIHILDVVLNSEHEESKFIFQNNRLAIQEFSLIHGRQRIALNGVLDFEGKSDVRLDIENLNFSSLAPLFKLPAASGFVTVHANLSGTAAVPLFEGDIEVKDLYVKSAFFQQGRGTMKMRRDSLTWSLDIALDSNSDVHVRGFIPLNWYVRHGLPVPLKGEPFQVQIQTDEIALGYLQLFSDQMKNASGAVICNVNLSNTLENPLSSGTLSVRRGQIAFPELGLNYRDIRADVFFKGNHLSLRDLHINSGQGRLSGSGDAEMGKPGDLLNLYVHHLTLSANEFLFASTKDMELVFDGEIRLSGLYPKLHYDADVTVLRSRIFNSLMQDRRDVEFTRTVPLLLVNENTETPPDMPIKTEKIHTVKFYKNFSGTAKIEIPYNTWIRGPDMNMEISGTLSVIQERNTIRIFGPLKINRGTYNFFGKIFKVKSGHLVFQGNPTVNPQIELEVEHVFRDADKNKNWLVLKISGSASHPLFQFFLNEQSIEQSDALSLIIFGRDMNSLTRTERAEISKQFNLFDERTAQRVFLNQVFGRVTEQLRQRLKLDFFEVKGEENWRQTSIAFGKYLTNDLYMSFEKDISASNIREAKPDRIALEYQFTKYLGLQAIQGDEKSSGFDLILKFEK